MNIECVSDGFYFRNSNVKRKRRTPKNNVFILSILSALFLVAFIYFQFFGKHSFMNAFARSPSSDPETVIMPQEYQVFQRHTVDLGDFALNLRIRIPSVDLIRVRVFDSKGQQILFKELYGADLHGPLREGDIYKNTFELRAGGWYYLIVDQVNNSIPTTYTSVVDNFGIGDVFVTAGQSNSTSAGEILLATQTGMAVAYDPDLASDGATLKGPGKWILSRDPQPPETIAGGSVWPAMADELAKRQGIPIATAECGVGGTTIFEWQKDYNGVQPRSTASTTTSEPEPQLDPALSKILRRSASASATASSFPNVYVRFMNTVKYLKQTTGVRMILWHQGETDHIYESHINPSWVYADKLKKLQYDLSQDVGGTTPWMVAKTSYVPAKSHEDGSPCDPQEFWDQFPNLTWPHSIWHGQKRAIDDGAAFMGPDTDQYKSDGRYPGPKGACIHFNGDTQKKVGKDWADKIVKIKPYEFPLKGGSLTIKNARCVTDKSKCICLIDKKVKPYCEPIGISWSVTNPKSGSAKITVTINGQTHLFGNGFPYGEGVTPDIHEANYVFRLYDGETLLDQAVIQGIAKPR